MTAIPSCPRPAADTVYRDLAEGGVVLHLGSGEYHGVNPVGALIWSLLDGTRTVPEVAAALNDRVEDPPPELETDVSTFVAELHDRGLLAD
jgi:hypothetical protein